MPVLHSSIKKEDESALFFLSLFDVSFFFYKILSTPSWMLH